MKKRSGLWIFLFLFLISLFIIFFVNKGTEGGYEFTTNGLSGFKRGLDIAGGVKLTYKVDYSKYEQIYEDPRELNLVKKEVDSIIKTNIDNRVSKLGVSDYQTYDQTMNDQEYIVVEIGGVLDLEEAKKIIGKTVELEFKVENDNPEDKQVYEQRLKMTQDLLKEVVENPELFAQLGSGKQSQDIYYSNLKAKKLSELPIIYGENSDILADMATGQVYNTYLSGTYDTTYYIGEDQQPTLEELNGWTIFKLNDRTVKKTEKVNYNKISLMASKYDLGSIDEYEKVELDFPAKQFEYDAAKDQLVYNAGQIATGQAAYDIQMYKIPKQTFGQTEEQIQAQQDLAQQVADTLSQNQKVDIEGVEHVRTGWMTQSDVVQNINGFQYNEKEPVQVYTETDAYYIIKINDNKKADQPLTRIIRVNGIGANRLSEITDFLTTEYTYDIQDIFVRDYPTWTTAIDSEGKILNGAYFKYASVGQGQLGNPVVLVNFNDEGKEIFCSISKQYVGEKMAIFVGGVLQTAPTIQEQICGGTAQISGNYTNQSAKQLVQDLNEGALPAPLILAQEEKISPLLGENALRGAIIAGGVGFVLIFIMMIFYYGIRRGIIAILSLLTFVVILFAIVKFFGYALSLSGIAAIILSIGMGVDANVLIFERIIEESKQGKGAGLAVKDGYEKSLSAIRDGNLTTASIGLLLFMMGINVFKGFGLMMIVNIFLTLTVIVVLTRQLLLFVYMKDEK